MAKILLCLMLLGVVPANAWGVDCNRNGVPDQDDIAAGTSADCDLNTVPDECDIQVEFQERPISTDELLPRFVRAADLDGDGDPDVLSISEQGQKLSWYENVDGSGGFGARQIIGDSPPTYCGCGDGRAAAADVDGDGDLDVLSASPLVWYRNTDGAGSFSAPQVIGADPQDAIFPADLDGDGDLDVLAGSRSAIVWYENTDGAGSFGPARVILDLDAGVVLVHAADLDGDSDADVLLYSDLFTVYWFRNVDGQGAFGPPQVVSSAVATATSLGAVDIDGDGDRDVLHASGDSPILAWNENLDGSGSFGPNQIISSYTSSFTGAFAGDLDNDGDLDVVAASRGLGEPAVFLWLEHLDGAGLFGPERTTAELLIPWSVAPADVDGDGDLDFFSADSAKVSWWENGGDDCNGNRVPDVCEPNCNTNSLIDTCEIALDPTIDCDRNGMPDTCDTGCVIDCDLDGDACDDGLDCDGQDGGIWSAPGALATLRLERTGNLATLVWQSPANPGAVTVSFDTLRSPAATDFVTAGVCLEGGDADLMADDADVPEPGTAFYYVIRVRNACPGDAGTLGEDSSGLPRSGVACP